MRLAPACAARTLLLPQRDVDFLDRSFDMPGHAFTVAHRHFFAGLMQQAAGFFQMPVRFPLPFLAGPFAAKIDPEFVAGGFHFLHRRDPVSVVIMIRIFQMMIGVGQFLARGFGIGADPEGQGHGGCEDDGGEGTFRCFHTSGVDWRLEFAEAALRPSGLATA